MNAKTLQISLRRTACAMLAFGMLCQSGLSAAYAIPEPTAQSGAADTAASWTEDLSKYGNPVTEYTNDEDHQHKTILWAQGITPPKMGGSDSQFQKHPTYDANGDVAYMEYIAPYLPGNGWYDTNKSEGFVENDANLCFAASASNSLHWWMDRNRTYIDRYLLQHPEDLQIQKLKDLRSSFEDQQHSGVYEIFRQQFANKKEGYWPDILQDQFINGYYPKANGAMNDSDADREKLLNGPDKHGGFFFPVFGVDRLTERRYYDNGYAAINRELKELFLDGNLVLLTFSTGRRTHVVTLWGVEFDPNGNVCGVYYSDSDDAHDQGMLRFRLLNINGKAVVTTHVNGLGNSTVQSLSVLSSGKRHWERYFNDPKTTLDLTWSNTDLVYNGQAQAPSVSAANLAAGDKVTLTVEGSAVRPGSYTATAALSGPDADRYQLPENASHSFVIRKAPAPSLQYPAALPIQYGQTLADSALSGGSTQFGSFAWASPELVPTVQNNGYPVHFVPSASTEENYEPLPSYEHIVPLSVQKADSTVTVSAASAPTDGGYAVTFTATLPPVGKGALPTGSISFEVTDAQGAPVDVNLTQIPVVNGIASGIWTTANEGRYTVKAVYSGDANYIAASSTAHSFDTGKQLQESLNFLPIGDKTYGDDAFLLQTTGGSGSGAVSFRSSDPSVLSVSGQTVTIHRAGTATLTATKAGDADFQQASVSCSVVVAKRPLRIIADNKSGLVQGDALPELTYTVEGLVSGDQLTPPTLTIPIPNTDQPGDYPIQIEGGTLTHADSYAVTYVPGILSIQAKEVPPVPPVPPTPSEPSPDVTPDRPGTSTAPDAAPDTSNTGSAPAIPPAQSGPSASASDKNGTQTAGTTSAKPVVQNTITSSAQPEASAQPSDPAQSDPIPESTVNTTTPETKVPSAPESVSTPEQTDHPTLVVPLLIGLAALLLLLAAWIVYAWKRAHSKQTQ